MRNKSRKLGWAAVLAAFVWIYYDLQANVRKAVLWGYVTIGLTAAHIVTVKR